MTHPSGPRQAPATAPEAAKAGIHLEFAFTTPPGKITVRHLGKDVWSKADPESGEECDLSLPWPAQGGELLFQIEWPANAPLSAMRVKLTDPQGTEIERTAWGRGPVEKTLGFP
jgi:hypothetical protein